MVEFKNEAFGLFEGLLDRIDAELARRIFRVGVMRQPRPEIPLAQATTNVDTLDQTGLMDTPTPELGAERGTPAFAGSPSQITNHQSPATNSSEGRKKIGRNDPCPCGAINPETSKPYKYKKCGLINAPYHRG